SPRMAGLRPGRKHMSPTQLRRLFVAATSTLGAVTTSAMAMPDSRTEPYGPPMELRHACDPVAYPVEAALRYAQGVSRIRYRIAPSGRADAIEVVGRAGTPPAHDLLDGAAVRFLKGCRFEAEASAEEAPMKMDYVWRLGDIGRDRWVMMRAVDTEDPP